MSDYESFPWPWLILPVLGFLFGWGFWYITAHPISVKMYLEDGRIIECKKGGGIAAYDSDIDDRRVICYLGEDKTLELRLKEVRMIKAWWNP